MKTSIYTRHRFHLDVIRRTFWMYVRFNLSFRDIEELVIVRGVDVYGWRLCHILSQNS